MREYIECWRRRTPFSAVVQVMAGPKKDRRMRWPELAQRIREIVLIEGHGPGSELEFVDFIPGPRLMEAYPPEPFPEGEKLRARFVGNNPAMEAVLAKRKANEINSQIH